ncbi:MAG: hypothetical protein AAFO81_13205 [Pseudomonadota bacterium]
MRIKISLIAIVVCLSSGVWAQALADAAAYQLSVETGGVGFSRNDIRIPNDTGTKFDMTELTGSGPTLFLRLNASVDLNSRHGLRFVAAPLEVSDVGTLVNDTEFAGEQFPAGLTDGTYQFNTYKLTYRYTFVDRPGLRWRVGFTGVVRDANVELRRGALQANDDNVGFVPTLHLSSEYRVNERWMMRFDFDGLAGGPGRLFDVALKLDYAIDDHWRIGGGYRTLEGGADTDDVFSFGWLHYGVVDIRYQF